MDKTRIIDLDGEYDVLAVKDGKTIEYMERNASEMLQGEKVFLYPYVTSKDYTGEGTFTARYQVLGMEDHRVRSFALTIGSKGCEKIAKIPENANRMSMDWLVMNPRMAVIE